MKWTETTVGEFCPFTYGKAIKKQDQKSHGVPVYGSNGVYAFSEKALAGPYVVVIGRKGSVGQVHLSSQSCWVSDTAFYISFESLAEASFVAYLLRSLGLEDMNTDAAVPGLNRNNAHRLEIRIPDSPEERAALVRAAVVIDKKISLCSRINQTLEQMAQAIFKSWFVDFEPVKAKIAALEAGGSEEDALLAAMQAISGKGEAELTRLQAEQPEQYAELRTTAELFPSAMQDSELGEIPEGWTPTKLERHIELAYGKALKKDARVEGQYRVYGSGGVTGSHHEFLIPGPGIIVGRKGTVGSIYWEPDNFYPIDTTFYVTVKNGYSLAFAYYLLQTLGLSSMNT